MSGNEANASECLRMRGNVPEYHRMSQAVLECLIMSDTAPESECLRMQKVPECQTMSQQIAPQCP